MIIDDLIQAPQYSLAKDRKDPALLEALNRLSELHRSRCPEYARVLDVLFKEKTQAGTLEDVPYIPVAVFKERRLQSVPDHDVFKVLKSSGTTGQRTSTVVLDRNTARRQVEALTSIMTHVLGSDRMPMLIVDSASVLTDRTELSARGAGILGMMNFGRHHRYLLRDDMSLDHDGLEEFLGKFGHSPFLLFGFTFMVWEYLYKPARDLALDLSNGVLIHSGGWKKLREEAVDNHDFRTRLRQVVGLEKIYNFYGMVEQVGSVFLEGEDGFLYTPNFADVVVRDPVTWEESPFGEEGVIQVLSALPTSYPGHSILTEDMGIVHGHDDSRTGRHGRYFSVTRRIPKTELRGCSDTHAYDRNP